MRITYILVALVVLLCVWGISTVLESQGQQQRSVIKAAPSIKVPLSAKEQRIVNNLKPGQVAVKRVVFAPDQETAHSIGKCCPKGKCCCTCQCEPKPCVCTCTDEIVVR